MYKIQFSLVKLSNLISKFRFINTNQMSIRLFPVMHLYALQYRALFKICYSDQKMHNMLTVMSIS